MFDCKSILIVFTIAIIFLVLYYVQHVFFHNYKEKNFKFDFKEDYGGLEDVTETIEDFPYIDKDDFSYHPQFYVDETFGNIFIVGDRVIVRSNEPTPLMIGTMIGTMIRVDLITQAKNPMPIVKDEKDGKEYLCFSLLKPYDKTLFAKLSEMQSLEQYNYLLATNNHCDNQIKEKYGVKYNTFNKEGEVIK